MQTRSLAEDAAADGSCFLATTVDEDLVALMSDADPLGAAIVVRSTEHGNRVTLA